MQRARFAALAAGFSLLLSACGSDTTTSPSGGTSNPPPTTAVASVELTPTTGELIIGKTTKLTATPRDANGSALSGRAIIWASSSPSIATVDANGTVTGVAAGSTTISAASEGKSASANITVKLDVPSIPVATVTVAAAPDTLEAWDPSAMSATLRDANTNILTGRVVRWSVSNPAVATIDGVTGILTGVEESVTFPEPSFVLLLPQQ